MAASSHHSSPHRCVCDPCGCTGPHAVALWLCCHCYEVLFLSKELHIFSHFALSPTNHAVGPASGPAGRAGLPFRGSWIEDYIQYSKSGFPSKGEKGGKRGQNSCLLRAPAPRRQSHLGKPGANARPAPKAPRQCEKGSFGAVHLSWAQKGKWLGGILRFKEWGGGGLCVTSKRGTSGRTQDPQHSQGWGPSVGCKGPDTEDPGPALPWAKS